jgi:hypothetical protein
VGAGVDHQRVQPLEVLEGELREGLARLGLGDVAVGVHDGHAILVGEIGGDGGDRLGTVAVQHEVVPSLRETRSGGTTDTAGGACDQGHPVTH